MSTHKICFHEELKKYLLFLVGEKKCPILSYATVAEDSISK